MNGNASKCGATWCNMVQHGAKVWKRVQDGAGWCKARWCMMVKASAIPCNTMQYQVIHSKSINCWNVNIGSWVSLIFILTIIKVLLSLFTVPFLTRSEVIPLCIWNKVLKLWCCHFWLKKLHAFQWIYVCLFFLKLNWLKLSKHTQNFHLSYIINNTCWGSNDQGDRKKETDLQHSRFTFII